MLKYHSLIDKVYNYQNLQKAFNCGKRRKGCSGPDNVSWKEYGENLENNLTQLAFGLKSGSFKFSLPDALDIIDFQGKMLHLHIWNVEDRIVQRSIKNVLSPIFEREFHDFSYGYRPKRGYAQAKKKVRKIYSELIHPWVVVADIRKLSASINRRRLKRLFCLRIADSKLIRLIEQAIFSLDIPGLPLGCCLSPLMYDVYLHEIDKILNNKMLIIRYGDNIMTFSKSQSNALNNLREINVATNCVELELNKEKQKFYSILH
ncbi:MAG: RNA-directed DNA polymerase (Reverse transcriptase) [Candidatus Magnetoglobus multicellularis str. Araruama]|uniref:RNA-directed DNA polymerase (Reverse transcriptase) n=1 Tax=Candidatus Magnetoglobus multicellularis str. Araruama TaxID=890399 RepID=A0A1V1P661_9BACT|nr:MAG: RNA-directed DNA polymerase (Reverse transcriptase) [Candidatus Magnetoglobus multicellularis str. Araruama]